MGGEIVAGKSIAMFYCVLSILVGLTLKANSQDLAYLKLMGASAFECRFCAGKSANIAEVGKPLELKENGAIIASKGEWVFDEKVDTRFPSITFRQIHRGEGLSCTAEISGNTGNISQVEGIVGPGIMTFIETMPMGVSVTTIFAEFDGKQELIAIHSRHSTFFSNIVASQYYGSCRPIAP
jgi:hypothetical protein